MVLQSPDYHTSGKLHHRRCLGYRVCSFGDCEHRERERDRERETERYRDEDRERGGETKAETEPEPEGQSGRERERANLLLTTLGPGQVVPLFTKALTNPEPLSPYEP